MKIQILGTGCAKCKTLAANAKQAVEELGIDAQIEKIEDIKEIMKFNVLMTPGLVIDGTVKSAGKLLSANDIKKLLEAEETK
jgi:small redox-active disulfide protein 2